MLRDKTMKRKRRPMIGGWRHQYKVNDSNHSKKTRWRCEEKLKKKHEEKLESWKVLISIIHSEREGNCAIGRFDKDHRPHLTLNLNGIVCVTAHQCVWWEKPWRWATRVNSSSIKVPASKCHHGEDDLSAPSGCGCDCNSLSWSDFHECKALKSVFLTCTMKNSKLICCRLDCRDKSKYLFRTEHVSVSLCEFCLLRILQRSHVGRVSHLGLRDLREAEGGNWSGEELLKIWFSLDATKEFGQRTTGEVCSKMEGGQEGVMGRINQQQEASGAPTGGG